MSLESHVDVLVIGAGPSGLMCANAFARAGIDVKIVDKRPTRIMVGHADGIQPRTLEVLQIYRLAERAIHEGNPMHIHAFYEPGLKGGIECTGRLFDLNPITGRYPWTTLNQGAIEAIFLDSMKDYGVEVERLKQPEAIEISGDELSSSSYPVKITLEHLDVCRNQYMLETVHAKFVVGADGARSWVRKALGIEMIGEQTEYVWGVIDMIVDTNFPDIRNPTNIHSTNGSCQLIPRERDLVRLYTQLSDTDIVETSTGKVDVKAITPEAILSLSRKILYPYEFADPKEIEWWTVYTITQQVASSFCSRDRVFITGDACHIHSATAGQGMNAGINDSHNLAWKLVHVLKGWSNSSLLKTYEYERKKIAEELIDFDKKIAVLMSGKPEREENDENRAQFFRESHNFMSGFGTHYSPSAIVDPKHQTWARNLIVGKRMLPHIFIRAADAHPIDIHDMLSSDARFTVLFFVGNMTETRISELNSLAEELSKPSSVLHQYSPDGIASTIFDIITISTNKKGDISYSVVPPLFRPHWSKVLLDDTDTTGSNGGQAYEHFGIDPKQITIVVVRPDGYVGTIVPAMALADMETYFSSFLIPRTLEVSGNRTMSTID